MLCENFNADENENRTAEKLCTPFKATAKFVTDDYPHKGEGKGDDSDKCHREGDIRVRQQSEGNSHGKGIDTGGNTHEQQFL